MVAKEVEGCGHHDTGERGSMLAPDEEPSMPLLICPAFQSHCLSRKCASGLWHLPKAFSLFQELFSVRYVI